jgi:hypothetical protein
MIDFREILRFYKSPLQIIRKLLLDKDLKWIYPIVIYLISFGFAFIPVIIVKLINSKIDVLSTFYYVPLLTIPFILILTLTGTIFFKEFTKNFQSQLYSSTLIVSYDFVIGLLLIICAIGLNYLGILLTPMIVAMIYVLIILISRLFFNLKIYTLQREKIWIKSIIEIVLTIILSILIIGGLTTIINAP